MNRKTWDDDNLLDGEIIHCNVCGEDEACFDDIEHKNMSYGAKRDHLGHTCYYCGWDIHQTEKSVEVSYDQVEYGHEECADKQYGCSKEVKINAKIK